MHATGMVCGVMCSTRRIWRNWRKSAIRCRKTSRTRQSTWRTCPRTENRGKPSRQTTRAFPATNSDSRGTAPTRFRARAVGACDSRGSSDSRGFRDVGSAGILRNALWSVTGRFRDVADAAGVTEFHGDLCFESLRQLRHAMDHGAIGAMCGGGGKRRLFLSKRLCGSDCRNMSDFGRY